MDKLQIKDLEVFAFHGVFEEEKKLGQKFIISIELALDLKKPAQNRELQDTIDYGELCKNVVQEFTKESYDLIETAADQLCQFILLKHQIVQAVIVNVRKPWAPIQMNLDYVEVSLCRKRERAIIAIGSNMGDKAANIKNAIRLLDNEQVKVCKVSTMIETKPWGYEQQELFLNGAIEVETILSPRELLINLQTIEKVLKRERVIKWGPRTIDLDIIFFGNEVIYEEDLIIPHPLMAERKFVLEPICEIAPYFIHPILHQSISDLLKECK